MADRVVDTVLVRWYERRDRSPGIVDRWLRAAEEHLPEAMPRRYGDTEPLRGSGGFAAAYARASSLFFLSGTPPVHHASLSAGHGVVAVHTLQAELPIDDIRVRNFALALVHPGVVYVSASLEGGLTLDRGTLWGPGSSRGEPYLAPHGDWLGLPPEPPAWCWFGPVYRRVRVGSAVSGGRLWTSGPWVRPSLQARLSEVDPARRYAPRRPRGLRRSVLLGALGPNRRAR